MRPIPSSALAACLLPVLLFASTREEPEVPDFWRLVRSAVAKGGAEPEFDAVLAHMAGIVPGRVGVAHCLARVDLGLARPWTPPAMAEELRALLERPALKRRGARFEGLTKGVADWLDLADYEDPAATSAHAGLAELDGLWDEVADPERSGVPLLEALSAFMELAHVLLEEALAGLDETARSTLFEGHTGFCEAWYRGHFPDAGTTTAQDLELEAFKVLLVLPDDPRGLVLSVADGLLRLAEPEFVDGLRRRLGRVDEDVAGEEYGADVLAVVGDAPRNRVILTGRKGSSHANAAALVIDLGGDDRYERAAVVDSPDMLVSVAIDLGGDDVYTSERPGPAYALGGVALLVDRAGEDRYVSKRLGQAASALGFAALVDLAGDDEYTAEDYVQGHSVAGVALLYDMGGDDTYSAWAYAQGAGIAYGLSALIDGAGNDRYLADLHWPDTYGTSGPDVYHGASQGYCTGLRSDIGGGIAALLDLGDGADRYQAGSFSQGGGYYYSFGLMFDGGGDDENFGSRYAQGFGVHQGIGVRWDAAGDDTYTCRSVAHTGMSWDEGVGYLLEDGGDDIYRTGGLSCGGAAQTGVAVCIDMDGADTYATGGQSQGGTGGFEYHDKPALGVLLDLGGDKDERTMKDRSDATLRVSPGVEVFLDTKAKNFRSALRSKELRGSHR